MARSCHHNKSQHADPFIVLSIIIAGKTKYVKDPFWCQIRHKARCDKGCRPYRAFWENWSNARMYMLGRKKKRRERYAISGLVHPCNLAGFRVTLS
ncbi:hypothetical protein CEG93_01155 (plasmid) [Raoultella ornithinolytica]|nr:hypothetical protein CEG93_28695 [Raoultella ornithinolytica]OWP46433.1 hypothetical protein CEG93_01155 [Raoultella ornithinolytica]